MANQAQVATGFNIHGKQSFNQSQTYLLCMLNNASERENTGLPGRKGIYSWDGFTFFFFLIPGKYSTSLGRAIEESDVIPQDTINSRINSTRRRCCARGKWWSHQIPTCFLIHTSVTKPMHICIPSRVKSID
jgi:hypothetical protein